MSIDAELRAAEAEAEVEKAERAHAIAVAVAAGGWSQEQLDAASPEAVARALKEGRLTHLL